MSDIYYGRVEHPWAIDIESWPEQPAQEIERLTVYQDSINQHVASLAWPSKPPEEEADPTLNTKKWLVSPKSVSAQIYILIY